jgi:hypothetical protein
MRPALARCSLAAAAALAVLALALGCGSSKEPAPAPGSASASTPAAKPPPPPPREATPAPPLTGGDFPAACAEYRETIQKLARCGDALPASTRDGLQSMFDRQWATWEKLPEKDKAELATICKGASDGVKAAASAACGW